VLNWLLTRLALWGMYNPLTRLRKIFDMISVYKGVRIYAKVLLEIDVLGYQK